ncbi:unnamed protein product [Vitrella brassicaformis CCMP3155]|uniref:PH domain-containing protein n=2 Tax=Vitrella brassicaformis TaxID=1169539 RepID=A0A0G4FZ83_VITBC|nr:unnamed protein product [Vitrella brassicaformis CCMP3155]|mmetsp:Transcript_926/g.2066  ORF Transcript_926/g.2066 Transcript_926/m.2066 type:complete len:124 (+) Transcript_926:136-507(+)|eukprot:CEM20935.1 unnamed protein product [Vitrella brassicaformis CCMP3155]
MMTDNIVISREEIVKEGWLSKQSRFLRDWRRRWFILTPHYLASFRKQGQYTNPTEILRLRDCSTVKSADDEVHKDNAFRVDTPGRVFFLVADTTADKESWIGHIGRQMVRPSVMTDYDDGMEQ